MRLLTQLAVEVFQCESEGALTIESRQHAYTDFFTAVGFKSVRNGKVVNEVQEIGPIGMPVGDNKLRLCLIKAVNSDQTQLSSPDGDPALLNFQLNCEPITWEEQIRHNPLLSTRKGPILPKLQMSSGVRSV